MEWERLFARELSIIGDYVICRKTGWTMEYLLSLPLDVYDVIMRFEEAEQTARGAAHKKASKKTGKKPSRKTRR